MFRRTQVMSGLVVLALAACGGATTSLDVVAPEVGGEAQEQARPVGAAPFVALARLEVEDPDGAAWWEEFELDYRAPDDWTMTYRDGATEWVALDGERVDAEAVRIEVHTLPGTVETFDDGVLVRRPPDGEEVRTLIEETREVGLRPGPWFPHEGLERAASGDPEGPTRLRGAGTPEGSWLALGDGTPLSYVAADGTTTLELLHLERDGRQVDLARHRDLVLEHLRSAGAGRG